MSTYNYVDLAIRNLNRAVPTLNAKPSMYFTDAVAYVRQLQADDYISVQVSTLALRGLLEIHRSQHPTHRKEELYHQEIHLLVNPKIGAHHAPTPKLTRFNDLNRLIKPTTFK